MPQYDSSAAISQTSSDEGFNVAVQSQAVESWNPDHVRVNNLSRYSTRSSHVIPDGNKQTEREDEIVDPFEVTFEGSEDSENIVARMSYSRKILISVILAGAGFCVTMLSSVWSLSMDQMMAHFHVSREVATLGISLYIFGLGSGPVFLSPISEFYGRRIVYLSGLLLCFAFQFITCFANNFGAILFSRFVTGFFGSAFMSVAGGTYSDIFTKQEIYFPFQGFVLAPFLSPAVGAFLSGIVNEYSNFHWCFYFMLIFTGCMCVAVSTIPETYKPYLLKLKAQRMCQETGDDRYYAPLDKVPNSLLDTIVLSCRRPFGVLFLDPMMFTLCFYTGFTLSIIYMFFICLPYVLSTVYDFGVGAQGLCFLSFCVGMIATLPLNYYTHTVYEKKVARNGGVSQPEMRFTPLKYGVFFIPSGLMIIAWTSYRHVHWIGVLCGAATFGGGVSLVFSGVFTYTVDGYRLYSASALAANSFTRSLMAGIFPLFGYYVYRGLGVNWASFLMAMVGVVMMPMPFVFERYGPYLRSKSPYAWVDDDNDEQELDNEKA
ncbi:Yhk8 protein [Saccharomycopsis crataegensis]|uniref:Yhk8 protein n=1 Tax=Saccharomycopsis crataegensis TaxID=43959 RepID=A0AAV5QIH9_9ASCO|nr:Yhk8 protein [Saccharomycopsis crataegensis]